MCSSASRRSFARAVEESIAAAKELNTPSDVASIDAGEDSDDWLNIDADMLDGMLKSQSTSNAGPSCVAWTN